MVSKLSKKQQDIANRKLIILQDLVDGYSPKEIAQRLNVSANVIFPNIRNIIKEYGSTQRAAIIHYLSHDITITNFKPQ